MQCTTFEEEEPTVILHMPPESTHEIQKNAFKRDDSISNIKN
jgi:hypothetical protein